VISKCSVPQAACVYSHAAGRSRRRCAEPSCSVKPIAFLIIALRPIVVLCSSTGSPCRGAAAHPDPREMAGGRTRPPASLDRRFLRLSRRRRGFLGLVRGGGLPDLLDQYLQSPGRRDAP